MNAQEFEALLRKTLEDQTFSRSERQAISLVLADLSPPASQLGVFRKTAFDLARQQLQHAPDAQPVLNWLEEVVKALQPGRFDNTAKSEVYFSPGNACRNRIVGLLKGTSHTADICVFTITDDMLAEAVLQAHHRGVQIRIISDDDKAGDTGSDMSIFEQAGISVRFDTTPHHMHHKFAIFDGDVVLTGSYNWTRGAARDNQENLVVLSERPLIARFQKQFDELWTLYE